ncbi:hypothetical protein M407DRAFT_232683, partial [Tulasnella calospora MUT 4182]
YHRRWRTGVRFEERYASRPFGCWLGRRTRIATQETVSDRAHISKPLTRLVDAINSRVEHVVWNGDPNGFPTCFHPSFSHVEGETLLMACMMSRRHPLARARPPRWSLLTFFVPSVPPRIWHILHFDSVYESIYNRGREKLHD